jgi:large subunit ribosomal protein L25
VHISHVALPAGARPTISDRDFTIATIAAPTVVAEEAEAAQAAAEEEKEKEAAEAEAPTESSSE